MITDQQANSLFLADCLPTMHPEFYARFEKVLDENNIKVQLLPHTKDIWAVDYMPIQTSKDKFVQFKYTPDYLQFKKYEKSISDVDSICLEIGIHPVKSSIVLDGGNVIRASDKVIMTDKIFKENPNVEEKQLIRELKECFEVDTLFFVPQQPGDFTGHSDGMVRFLDDHTILINDYTDEKPAFLRAFKTAIHNTGLNVETIPYNPYGNKTNSEANGYYINYLQMDGIIMVPTFGIKEDDAAVRRFEDLFKGCKVVTVQSNEIAKHGGVLNCIAWNIQV